MKTLFEYFLPYAPYLQSLRYIGFADNTLPPYGIYRAKDNSLTCCSFSDTSFDNLPDGEEAPSYSLDVEGIDLSLSRHERKVEKFLLEHMNEFTEKMRQFCINKLTNNEIEEFVILSFALEGDNEGDNVTIFVEYYFNDDIKGKFEARHYFDYEVYVNVRLPIDLFSHEQNEFLENEVDYNIKIDMSKGINFKALYEKE
jgi:hypothetical protein